MKKGQRMFQHPLPPGTPPRLPSQVFAPVNLHFTGALLFYRVYIMLCTSSATAEAATAISSS